MKKYANRNVEFDNLMAAFKDDNRVVIIEAYKACGITDFMNVKALPELDLDINETFWIDGTINPSLSAGIFEKIILSQFKQEFQKYLDRHIGEKETSSLTAFMQTVPYFGDLLGHAVEPRKAPSIYTGNYASAVEEHISHFLRDLYQYKIMVVIDNVQNLTEDSFDLLYNLTTYENIYLVLIRTEPDSQILKLSNYLRTRNTKFISLPFTQPHTNLIIEIGKLYNLELTKIEAESIFNRTEQNIHKIISEILSISSFEKPNLEDIDKAILWILSIFEIQLSHTDIKAIINQCDIFMLNQIEDYNLALEKLKRNGLINYNDSFVFLNNYNHPSLIELKDSYVEFLLYANHVYQYLCSKQTLYPELRYKLSKKLQCTTCSDARAYLNYLVVVGRTLPDDVIQYAELEKGNYHDCLLSGITLCRERKFEEALDWVKTIPASLKDNNVIMLEAVLLDRTRQIDEANLQLIACLEKSIIPSQRNLLAAILLTNFIHAEKINDAKALFEKMEVEHPTQSYYGYLLRNAASAFHERRLELYDKALNAFRLDNDEFGLSTTLCNKGYAFFLKKDYTTAEDILLEAQKGIEKFSKSHFYILYNDLGLCKMFLHKYQEAASYFTLAINFSKNSMPKLFATINKACLYAITNNVEKALKIFISIEQEVENHPLDRVRQKYYINRLWVECLNGNRDLNKLITLAKKYPDRYYPEKTANTIQICEDFISSSTESYLQHDWGELFSPCGLVYWYMDPLKLLPIDILQHTSSM